MTLRTALLLALVACGGGSKDDDSAAAGGTESPEAACTTMCTDAGFDAGTADVYDHEVNCTCTGSGTVTDEGCTDLCDGLGWSSAEAYDVNACQCSDG